LPLLWSQTCDALLPAPPEQNPRRRRPRPMGIYLTEDAQALLSVPSRGPGRTRAALLPNRPRDDGPRGVL
jgi:hypothetical protein